MKKLVLALVAFLLVVGIQIVFAQTPPQPMLLRPWMEADSLCTWPPFVHWDLREFPNCRIPWSLGANLVPDVDGVPGPTPADRTIVASVIATSFAQWEAVDPAIIGFTYRGDAPGKRGLALDGYNTVGFGDGVRDDIQVVAYNSAVPPGGDIITPGPNGILETIPTGDDIVSGSKIIDGGNGIADSNKDWWSSSVALGITGIFCNRQSGVIQEADIALDPNQPWVLNPAVNNLINNCNTILALNLRGVVTHEIGHFIGIGHCIADDPTGPDAADGATPTMYPYVCYPFVGNNFNQTLENSDKDSCNFLYCPDLGDAPDPCVPGQPGFYPSLVHWPNLGRILNGLTLDARHPGAEHIFGIKRVQRNRMWTYEWLARPTGDAGAECEANVTDADPYDDGVTWTPDPPVWGRKLKVTATVAYAADDFGREHDYSTRALWVNAFMDLNQDCEWNDSPAEHFMDVGIYNPMIPLGPNDIRYVDANGSVQLPATVDPDTPMYLRARVDWGEDVGQGDNIDGTLNFSRFAAQFGEVEDYPFWCREKYEGGWLINNTLLPVYGIATVFVGPYGVEQNVVSKATPTGCPAGGSATVSTIFENIADESITTYTPPLPVPPGEWWRWGKCLATPTYPPVSPALTLARMNWNDGSPFVTPIMQIPSVNVGVAPVKSGSSITALRVTVGAVDKENGGWIGELNPVTHAWEDTLHVSVSYRVAPTVIPIAQLNPCDPSYASLAQVAAGSSTVTPDHGYRFTLTVPGNIQQGKALIVESTVSWRRNSSVFHQITEFPNPLPVATGISETPRSAQLALENHPNPFNPSTMISFALPKAVLVTLKVYDVQGRLVRTLISGASTPYGTHAIEWNGTDNRGAPVSSGVYFYRLTAGREVLTRKAVLLK